jgi:plastocyanin
MRQIVAAGTALLCLAGIGCAKDKDESTVGQSPGTSSSSSTGSAPVALSGTVNDKGTTEISGATADVVQGDFFFQPTYIKAKPGTNVNVRLGNGGQSPHTFTIDGLVDVTLQPGEKKSVDVQLPMSGATRFYCKFHASQGMQGAFFFNAGDTVAPGGSAPSGSSSDDGGAYGQ